MSAITYHTPPAAPAPSPVRFPDLRGEWRIGREALRLAFASPSLLAAPRGSGEAVLLVPGWQAPEASMGPLRRLLKRKGYDARHWGEGTNRGNVERYLEHLCPRVRELAAQSGRPVAMVGWSLGGVISREVARECPEAVSCVVTYGSPVVGGPAYSVAASAYGPEEVERIAELSKTRASQHPITVPLATIFSRLDTIVSWPACIDRLSPSVVHYEVRSTHLSMGIDPTVWRIVLDHLGRHASADRR